MRDEKQRAKNAAYKRRYHSTPKGMVERLRYQLKKRYGITVEEYFKILAQQNGVCAICREAESKGRGPRLNVDHDHRTGRVRALLCHHCNAAIGYLRESPLLARAAATYLELQLASEFT